MIEEPWIVVALRNLGFTNGWAASGDEIVLWELDAPQPTFDELKAAFDANQ